MKAQDDFRSSNFPATGRGADLALVNGRIYTVDPAQPWATALAVRDGQFIAVGSDSDIRAVCDGDTRLLDLKGRFVMPGLYDMHTHPDLALAPKYANDLDVGGGDPTPDQVKAAIQAHAAAHPGDGWIYGQYFVRYTFKQAGLTPGRDWLDSFMPDRPVAIMDRMWGTMMANSKALELAGIDAGTPDPRNGYLERDGLTGEPTGLLIDGAYALVHGAMPPTPMDALYNAYRDTVHFQTSRGVVASKYMHVCERRLDSLKRLDDGGELTLRVEAAISWQDDIFPVRRRWELLAGERHYYRSARLSANAVKFHFDGTVEPRSSFMISPWPGENSWRGKLNLTPEHITDMLVDMDRRGIRVVAHCTGDAASDIFLDAVAEARRRNGPDGPRHQCAHCTILDDGNLARFRELDVIAEFSPVGWYPSPFVAGARAGYGRENLKRAFNIKGVVEAGGNAVMGTDWPVSFIDPWIGFEAMITRANPWGEAEGTFGEGISLEQAIRVMTINGAYAMGIEESAGSISVGKSADFIALDRNLFDIEPGQIHDTSVELTMLQGQLTYDRAGLLDEQLIRPVWRGEVPSLESARND